MSRKLLFVAALVAAFTLILDATDAQARGRRYSRGYRSRSTSGRVYTTRVYSPRVYRNYGGYGYRGGYGNYGYRPRGGISIGFGTGGFGNYGGYGYRGGYGNYGYGPRGGISVGGFF